MASIQVINENEINNVVGGLLKEARDGLDEMYDGLTSRQFWAGFFVGAIIVAGFYYRTK